MVDFRAQLEEIMEKIQGNPRAQGGLNFASQIL
jgi:hypothetical protein